MKKILALALALALSLTLVTVTAGAEATGSVYYLNFKPEQDQQWQDLAKVYTEQTGVPVTVVTAASGTYEDTLRSEIEKADAPTLFQVNGPVGLQTWKDYCLDLKDTAVYDNLKSDDFALIQDDQVLGIAYVIETYGIIYNKELLAKYCALDNAVIGDASEINSFATLKAVADDIQARKDELGVMAPSPPPAWTAAPTGGSRPIWPTCPFITSTRSAASPPRTLSRACTWTTTSRFGTSTLPTPPVSPR